MRKGFLLAAITAAMMLVASIGHAETNQKPYTAGSVGFTVNGSDTFGLISANDAAGDLDCSTGTGGNCFDLHELGLFPGQQFTVTALDDGPGGQVGVFMGFDINGDNCVRCLNGAAGQNDGDISFQGGNSITGHVPGCNDGFCQGPPNWTLFVFVRVTTLNTGDVGTTGTLTLKPIQPGDPQCGERKVCQENGDKNMGQAQVCAGQDPAGGPGCTGTPVMYPYPCATCTREQQ